MRLTVDSGQLPVGWQVKKLGEICLKIQDGAHSSPQVLYEQGGDGKFLYITSRNIRNNYIDLTNISYVDLDFHNSIYPRCNPEFGDVLLTKDGSNTGNVTINTLNEPFSLLSSVCLIKTDPQKLISPFLVYYVQSNAGFEQITGRMTGAAIKRIILRTIKSSMIPLPPLSEQKRIVAILDEAFEGIDRAIANTEKNLANSRELFESYLNAIFTQKGDGWEKKTLQEVSIKFARGKSKHRPRGDKKLYGGKYPLIQTGDISNAKHRITSYSQTYNELGLAQSELWPQGTVCIAIVGANVAETAIIDFDACFPDSVIGIIVNEEVADSDYVEYLLQSFKAELKEKGKGTARDNINLGTFANQRFPFPDVKTQKIIAGQLEELSVETQHLEAIYRQKLAALNELKQSILQKAFTGELTTDTPKTVKEEIAA